MTRQLPNKLRLRITVATIYTAVMGLALFAAWPGSPMLVATKAEFYGPPGGPQSFLNFIRLMMVLTFVSYAWLFFKRLVFVKPNASLR